MATTRELVLLAGRLIGMGRDESCLVGATKVTALGSSSFTFVRCSIQNAPDDLPEGQYTLNFIGRTEAMKKVGGVWLAAGI